MASCEKCSNPHRTDLHSLIAYRKRNKEKVNEQTHKWYSLHREQVAEIRRTYSQTENGRTKQLNAIRKYEASNPERKKAWGKVTKYPKRPCIKCGVLPTHKHHPNINEPLKILYLCPLHHKQVHIVI